VRGCIAGEQRLSVWKSGGGQLDTAVSNACICFSCNLIRLRSAQRTASYQIHPRCLDTLSHIVDAVTAPAESSSAAPSDEEEEEEEESTALDLPGRSQAVTALETLQRYLLCSMSVTALKCR